MNRTPGITVETVDLSALVAEAAEARRQERPEVTSLDTGLDWARAVSPDGRLYLICDEGVGWEATDDTPVLVDLHEHTAEGTDMLPCTSLVMTPERIHALPVTGTKDLSQFIRTFGRRLDDNFRQWFHTLSPSTPATPDYEYEIQGHYGYGWECVTTEATLADAKIQKLTYDENEPDIPHRIKKVRTET